MAESSAAKESLQPGRDFSTIGSGTSAIEQPMGMMYAEISLELEFILKKVYNEWIKKG